MELKLYAIRHVSTDTYMPNRLNRAPGGWSYWSPTDEYKPYDATPRLFSSLRSAQNALTAWLQGEHRRNQSVSYDWEGNPDSTDMCEITEPSVPRVRSEMEIVSFLLVKEQEKTT